MVRMRMPCSPAQELACHAQTLSVSGTETPYSSKTVRVGCT